MDRSQKADGRRERPGTRRAASDVQPLILFAESPRGLFVTACSREAARGGVRPGMPLGEARSLLTGSRSRTKPAHGSNRRDISPVFQQADPAADRAGLQRLAWHCQHYSPLVGLEEATEPESLWLDLAGNEDLFGGEESLMEAIRNDFARQGFHVRLAAADTWGAAWAVSHFVAAPATVVAPGRHAETLAALPITALRVPDHAAELLRMLDISTIDRLMRLPRTALPSRFGKELLRRLDQALGLAPELLAAVRLVEPLSAEWRFEEPLADRQTLEHVVGVLLDQLLAQLHDRRAGLREVICRWLGATAPPISLRLLRPTADRRHLFELLRLQCERCVFTRGIGGVRMELVEMGLPPVRQTLLFEEEHEQAERYQRALAELIDRLGSRLGRQSVLRPTLRPDPQPEYACEHVPWLEGAPVPGPAAAASPSQLRCRPLRLLPSPQPLAVQASPDGLPTRVSRAVPAAAVVRIAGPERIETGWWRGLDAKRDYYRLDLANGAALWAFVDRDTGGWFLHGLFA